jgi:hypothetical protein
VVGANPCRAVQSCVCWCRHLCGVHALLGVSAPTAQHFVANLSPPPPLPVLVHVPLPPSCSRLPAAGRLMACNEIAVHPFIVLSLRRKFRNLVMVSSEPTRKGLQEIDAFHPYFGLHVLSGKPLDAFFSFQSPWEDVSAKDDPRDRNRRGYVDA